MTEVAFASRRQILLTGLAGMGIGTAVFQRALAESVQRAPISEAMIRDAEWVAGIRLSDEQRAVIAKSVDAMSAKVQRLRAVDVDFSDLPAFRFDPEMFPRSHDLSDVQTVSPRSDAQEGRPPWLKTPEPSSPSANASTSLSRDEWSFASVTRLAQALRAGELTSVELTEHCLGRLKQHDPTLMCVVTLMEESALEQAQLADRELAGGKDRGLLQGIPWGAKDLIAVEGFPTTWGAPQFRDRQISETATVALRMKEAGAVLTAKLSLGALAMGDQWFGGQTRNPWNPEVGSSGSSAGSAAAVSAGLLPLALGSETLGSIVSPCRRCGVTGLRPTFGRVSRAGCMSLSWTMDKIGPIARTAHDCGLCLNVIAGADHQDPTSVDRWFDWPVAVDFTGLRIGRMADAPLSLSEEAVLDVLSSTGAEIVDLSLPHEFSEWDLNIILDAEAATVFHSLTADNDLDGLNAWSTIFPKMHFLSAVDYLQACRIRMKLMQQMSDVFRKVHFYVGGGDLGIANMTGHPTVVIPAAMTEQHGVRQPECATITGRLYDEATILAVAAHVESELAVNQQRPPGF